MEVECNNSFFKLGCWQFVSNCNWLLWWTLDKLLKMLILGFEVAKFQIFDSPSHVCTYLSNNINYIQYNFVLHYYSIFIQLHPERMDVLILSISKCAKEEQRRAFIIFSTTFVFMKERVIFFVKQFTKFFTSIWA